MRRRTVLLFTSTAVAGLLPRAVRPQPVKLHRIGYLAPAATPLDDSLLGLFRQGLRALGYKDDDVVLEVRSANGQIERLPEMAAELVQLGPEVIVAVGPAAQAAKQATSMIPIVLFNVADPVAAGFVASLAHPGGNITGLANLAQETAGKRLQLLREASPSIRRVAFLLNPTNRGNILQLNAARQAAPTLHIELVAVEAQATAEIESAFAAMEREHADALFVPADPVFGQTSLQIAELAAKQKLPAIYQGREYVGWGTAQLRNRFR
jgi:putative ABC transport system substrate-binding protein